MLPVKRIIMRSHLALFLGVLLCLGAFNEAQAQYSNGPVTLSSANTTGNYTSSVSITLAPGFTSSVPFSAGIQTIPNPSLNQNFVITYTPRVPNIITSVGLNAVIYDKTQVQTDIQYFDGLGRPMQSVQVKGSPLGNDLVQPVVYDQLGREISKYLPYAVQNTVGDGSYKNTAVSDQLNFYNPAGSSGTQQGNGVARIPSPYAGINYEPSPLNRVIEQGAPGDSWQLNAGGHTVKTAYGTNIASDIINWTVNTGGATGTTYYGANTLYATTTTDEQGNNSIAYKDMQGRIICKRVQNGSTYLSTYYIYDDFNNLSYVIPPIPAGTTYPTSFAETDPVYLNFIYGYHYDERHRLVEKKIPGKDWEFYVYNAIDKIVATQDGVQRNKPTQEWTFTKYDQLGRVILTGVFQYSASTPGTSYRLALQSTVSGQAYLWETITGTGNGYTANAWPASWSGSTLTVNYYDNYSIPSLPSAFGAPSGYNPSTRSLPTASLTNVLGSTDMLWNVNYYDALGRDMKTYRQHYFGGVLSANNYDVILPSYNFTNAVTNSTRQHFINHVVNNVGSLLLNATIANTYLYDHEGRKTQTQEQMNGGNNIILSQLVYNEAGQSYKKQLHSEDNGTNFIETVAYSYNPRGWLTETSSPNFDEKLYYDSPSGSIAGLTGLYNGNILEAWYNSPSATNKGFAYVYDSMNRLTSSQYYVGGTHTGDLDENVSYDYLGNILQLIRGNYGNQSFTYSGTFAYTSYTGNRVNTILNNGNAYRTYSYDQNGNALTAGTFGYDYNMLDLPNDVKLNGGVFNTYTYDAAGKKLRKVSTASGYSTDYIDGIQYKNGVIDFIATEEGRFENSGSPVYQYDLKDHLGNVRVMIQKNTISSATAIQENEYYAFGLNVPRYDNTTQNKYLYNGKELQDENALNQYDYGARFYDPVIARWNTLDPLAETSRRWSPYNYVMNNPVRLIDPDGMYSGDPNNGNSNDGYNDWIANTDQQYEQTKKDVAETTSKKNGPTALEAAELSDAVYNSNYNDVAGYKRVDNMVSDIVYDDPNSGFKSGLYSKEVDGNTIYVYATAGSRDRKSWDNNVEQEFGASRQYDISAKNARALDNRFGDALSFTGHSLGGGLAALNAMVTGRSAITFNAAALSDATLKRYNAYGKTTSNITAHSIIGDPLTFVQAISHLIYNTNEAQGNHVYHKSPERYLNLKRYHDMDNFIKIFKHGK